jgi:hypothetical protein
VKKNLYALLGAASAVALFVYLTASSAYANSVVNGDFSAGLTGWTADGWPVGGPGTGISAADIGLPPFPTGSGNFAYTACPTLCSLSQNITLPTGDNLMDFSIALGGRSLFTPPRG